MPHQCFQQQPHILYCINQWLNLIYHQDHITQQQKTCAISLIMEHKMLKNSVVREATLMEEPLEKFSCTKSTK